MAEGTEIPIPLSFGKKVIVSVNTTHATEQKHDRYVSHYTCPHITAFVLLDLQMLFLGPVTVCDSAI